MDSTYKTNKYRQALFEIVGMTSTELTFAVAFTYMESEQTENFCWVLEKLKELFVKKDLCPQVILTDRGLALMKAIEIVFSRVESTHWKLKQMLGNSIGDMVKCWEAMNNKLRLQLGNIRASFQKSFYEVEHAHISPFFGYLRGSVSQGALRRIAEELLRVDYVGTNRKICGCTLRTSYGLPCACELGRYALGGIPIPIDVVHVHWRKLTMEVELEVGADDGSEVDMTCAMDELWKRFRSLDVIGKRALKSRVCELAYPTMTPLCPPPEKLKTKGGVKKKGKKTSRI
ncbi:hypothetical protein KIW84_057441 [Lathyrus oleraceus]|uniref:MULE transposase domain-containing protein n=1 Tax=Pisum sativum TaxID=3888 RepID=A0A9D4X5Y2_PEA|nr:hypothetical protein KIW84_057441 [Pisum sativum]